MQTPESQPFATYILALHKTGRAAKTEHSDRTALENLLTALAPKNLTILHEPPRQGTKGSPDFKITKNAGIIGYVEVKTIGENLDAVLKSDQIKKYLTLSKNLLITDYLHFIWLHEGTTQRESLAYPTDLESPKFKLNPDKITAVHNLISGFLSSAPLGLARAQSLAEALATRSHLLRDGLMEELIRQERNHTEGKLYGLLAAFRAQVFHDLTLGEFADAFAQTLAYGLFLARLNRPERETLTLQNARTFIPTAFPLIRELVDFLSELNNDSYAQIRWVVEEILSIMNTLNLAEITLDLSFASRKSTTRKLRAGSQEEHRLFERDPFIYFYEDFLAKYDAKLKKSRGVYYTPPPVVNFIIRAVDDILKSEFAIPLGLADHKRVTMLDFATGTGTFILEAIQRMFESIGDSQAKRDLLVHEHIVKNIYGFEFLIAPYTIAHLKISQFLHDKGHTLSGAERLQIYLTNTLEPINPQINYLLPALSSEAEEAQKIKKKPILVITGNPPYSGHSKNNGAWITAQINAYKKVDGQPLGEKNPKWLSDDYVKFIRFAQEKMDQVEEGIVGIITNHSFLDNPTFRGMRQSLMTTFNKIYLLDLHGNAKRKEKSPDGTKDENVFDIEQGVAISLFIKTKPANRATSSPRSAPLAPSLRAGRSPKRSNPEPDPSTSTDSGSQTPAVTASTTPVIASEAKQSILPHPSTIKRADFYGTRLSKYQSCARLNLQQIDWRNITPTKPFYLFESGDAVLELEYVEGFSVPDIFPVNSVGIITARDDLTIQFDKTALMQTVRDFSSRQVEDARSYYKLGKDVRDWQVEWAQNDVIESGLQESRAIPVLYRPFDNRWTYYTGNTKGFMCYPREEVMQHMLHNNVALSTIRKIDTSHEWTHVLALDVLSTGHTVSMKEINYVFPLYLYPPATDKKLQKTTLFDEPDPFTDQPRIENISAPFRAELTARYHEHAISPEQIFGYIYAILHAPSYRARYAQFLRGDFPRIPLPGSLASFKTLATLGWDLAQKHLLKDIPKHKTTYHGKGDNTVDKPRYDPLSHAVHINATQSFAPIAQDVWDFHIGGYQVIEKYLKSRKGRKLTLDEVTTIENIAATLAFTITQMQTIDSAYTKAFPAIFPT